MLAARMSLRMLCTLPCSPCTFSALASICPHRCTHAPSHLSPSPHSCLDNAGCHVLCLGPGAPLLAVLAVLAGATHAAAVPDSALAYLAGKALLSACGPHALPGGGSIQQRVQLAAAPLQACRLRPSATPQPAENSPQPAEDSIQPGANTSEAEEGEGGDRILLEGGPAHILATDAFDHRCGGVKQGGGGRVSIVKEGVKRLHMKHIELLGNIFSWGIPAWYVIDESQSALPTALPTPTAAAYLVLAW